MIIERLSFYQRWQRDPKISIPVKIPTFKNSGIFGFSDLEFSESNPAATSVISIIAFEVLIQKLTFSRLNNRFLTICLRRFGTVATNNLFFLFSSFLPGTSLKLWAETAVKTVKNRWIIIFSWKSLYSRQCEIWRI